MSALLNIVRRGRNLQRTSLSYLRSNEGLLGCSCTGRTDPGLQGANHIPDASFGDTLSFFAKAGYAKAGKQKQNTLEKKGATQGPGQFDIKEAGRAMTNAVQHFKETLASIRTGRASPGMLDHLKIDSYGEKMQLKSIGNVSVRNAQLLVVSAFDPEMLPAIEKVIRESDLQLDPRQDGQEILVPIPRPTSETLAAVMKLVKQEAESARVSVRSARKSTLDTVKLMESEDERHRIEKQVQKMTDEHTALIDQVCKAKEKEISTTL